MAVRDSGFRERRRSSPPGGGVVTQGPAERIGWLPGPWQES